MGEEYLDDMAKTVPLKRLGMSYFLLFLGALLIYMFVLIKSDRIINSASKEKMCENKRNKQNYALNE